MSKERKDLKNAFKALKVHEPLKLSKEVKFKAPTPSEPPVENSSTGGPTPWVERPVESLSSAGPKTQWAGPPTEEAPSGLYQKTEKPLGNSPSGTAPTAFQPVGKKPTGSTAHSPSDPVGKETSGCGSFHSGGVVTNGYKTQRVTQPSVGLPRGGESGNSPSPDGIEKYFPEERGPISWREKNGELYLPHKLLEFAIKATASRNELCVLLFFIRYTLGFRRFHCQAGYSFLTEWTGIGDISNLKKALKGLITAGLVRKLKEHDSISNTGAVYEVPVVRYFIDDPGGNPKNPTDQFGGTNLPTGVKTQGVETPPTSGFSTHGPLGDLPTKKENKKENKNNSLSFEKIPEVLSVEIESIRSPKKRKTESEALQLLLGNFDASDILIGYEHLKVHGVLGSGEKCHSPFRYLAVAGDQVISEAKKRHMAPTSVPLPSNQIVPTDEDISREKRTQILSAFESEVAEDTKERLISDFIRQEGYPDGFTPPARVLRTLVALQWSRKQGHMIGQAMAS